MTPLSTLVLVSSTALCFAANAQYVKGNEAVRFGPTGRSVETPQVPPTFRDVCEASAGCHAGAWRMVETDSGLMECTEPWARPKSCRNSTYGAQKLVRVWVVKHGGSWFQCQYPDLSRRCTPIFARPPANLPFDDIQ